MEDINDIANKLGINLSEATIFCKKVQELFTNPKPSVIQISKEIDIFEGKSPTPNLIAKQIAEKRKREYQNNKINKKPIKYYRVKSKQEIESDHEKFLSRQPKIDSDHGKSLSRQDKSETYNMSSQKTKYNLNRFNNDPRDFIGGVKKCPHGIPLYKTCGICNPKKYKDEYGID